MAISRVEFSGVRVTGVRVGDLKDVRVSYMTVGHVRGVKVTRLELRMLTVEKVAEVCVGDVRVSDV